MMAGVKETPCDYPGGFAMLEAIPTPPLSQEKSRKTPHNLLIDVFFPAR
jgi:hypothetical protein